MVKYYCQAGIGKTTHTKLPAYQGDTQKLIQVHSPSITQISPLK